MATRVLFWSELFWPYIGGAEIFSTTLVPELRERGYDVLVVTRRDSPKLPRQDRYQGVPIFRIPFYTGLSEHSAEQILLARQQLVQVKRGFAPNLVHVHGFGPTSFFYLDTANALRAPLLVTLTVDISHPSHRYELLPRLLASADWVTGKTAAILDQAQQLVPQIRSRSSVIHNGLDVPALAPSPLPFAAPRLLCLGRLDFQKGFDLALTAMASVIQHFPDARLLIAGDGPDRRNLEQRACELRLNHVVDFLGWVSPRQVFDLINTTTMVIMPSRWEGLPSVALQAGTMARPIIGTRITGITDVVLHEQTGLLVEREDPGAIALAVLSLLRRPEAAVRMGQAARERVREAFSWKHCVEAYEKLWRKLSTTEAPNVHPTP